MFAKFLTNLLVLIHTTLQKYLQNLLVKLFFSRWYHQVRSYATEKRNMAVNIWFYHMQKINETDCKENESAEFLPLDRYDFSKDKSIFNNAVK